MKNLISFLFIFILVMLFVFYFGMIIIPICFLLKLGNSNLNNIISERNQDKIFSTDFSVNIEPEADTQESFQDKVMSYLENLGIEDCESSISKIKAMRSEGSDPIVMGETFDVIFKDGKVLFQAPEKFESVQGLRTKIIKCILLFEMCISKKMDEDEKKSLNPLVRKLARKLASQKEIMDYEPIICV